jgi:hypothetical protein
MFRCCSLIIVSNGNPRIIVLYLPLNETPADELFSTYLKEHIAPLPDGSIASGASAEYIDSE